MGFKGKVVLITGGSSGIGAATAVLFAKEGALITIVGRNEAKLQNVANQCEKLGGTVLAIKANIAIDDEADNIVKQTIEKFGKLHVLINAAAVLKQANILDEDFLKIYDEVVNINVRAAVRITKFAIPYLIATKGNVINVSSIAAISCKTTEYVAYRASKAALSNFTRSTAKEVAIYGVRVNEICPGPVNTDIYRSTSITPDSLKSSTALKRISEPEEIADLILFVAGDKAQSVTGSNYIVDNGMILN